MWGGTAKTGPELDKEGRVRPAAHRMRSEWAAPEEDLPLMPDEAGFHATPPARVAPKVEEAMKVVDAMAVVDGRCQVCSYAVYALQPFGAKLLLPEAKAHYSCTRLYSCTEYSAAARSQWP
eukprot:SAG25_NODE_1699_length_2520_cov_3.208591_3_plen_121_part_00